MIENIYNPTNEFVYSNELHNGENMKKYFLQQLFIQIFQEYNCEKNLSKSDKSQTSKLSKKEQRFKWTNAMVTTLHSMLIHNENYSLQKIIKSFQHLHSNLNLNDNQILHHIQTLKKDPKLWGRKSQSHFCQSPNILMI